MNPSPPRRAWLADLLVLGVALVLAVAVTWPMAAHFFSQVPGDLLSDRDQNLWNLWWVKTALLDLHTNPYHTPLLYYPDGVDLYAHTLALPNGLIALGPQLLWGLPAAYNTVLLFALVLAMYGGYRLVGYVLSRNAGDRYAAWQVQAAALAGGLVFGLNTYGLDALKGQPEVLSYGWMPLYVEAWLRAWDRGSRRAAVLAGVFFAITLLTNFYYAVYLALFSLAYLVWRGVRAWQAGGAPSERLLLRQAAWVLGFAALPGLVILPYLIGLTGSILSHNFALEAADQQTRNSADLLSLLIPPRIHPWLGAAIPWWGWVNPAIHDILWPGWVAPLLGAVGLAAQRRRPAAWAWALGGAGAVVLALGPVLQINGVATLPLPWMLLQNVPVFSYVGKVERFLVLARLALAPLVGWGVLWIADRAVILFQNPQSTIHNATGVAPRGFQFVALGVVFALLLVELPWVARPTAPLDIPAGFAPIAAHGAPGALLELPLVAGQVRAMGARMLYQTAHQWPIVGGYLARTPLDPLPQCAPVWGLITWEPGIAARDIITPHIMSNPLALMQRLNIRYYAVYNAYDPTAGNLLSAADRSRFTALAAATSAPAPIYQDPTVTLYRVRAEATPALGPVLQLGSGWGGIEASDGRPFRWLQGGDAGLCLQGGAGQTVRLAVRATSFAQPRTLDLRLDGRTILSGTIPSGSFAELTTPPLTLSSSSVTLTLHVPEGGATPASLGQGADQRPLSLGFTTIRLEPAAPP